MSRKTEPAYFDEKRLRAISCCPKAKEEPSVPIGIVIEPILSQKKNLFSRAGQISQAWDASVPYDLQTHCRPAGLQGGVLTVEVSSVPYLHQLQMLSGQILEDMKTRCPRCGLKAIRFLPGIIESREVML